MAATARATCRSCGGDELLPVVSLGETPLANSLLDPAAAEGPERRFPLELAFCPACALVQITVSVPPDEMFVDYPYFSSFADTVAENARAIAERMADERGLGSGDLAMELASNDGYLLQHYARRGIPVLGVDPARNVVAAAEERGVPTICDFFGLELAERLRGEGRRAAVVHANNVLAHVPDVNGFVGGIARVLADDGVAVIETPYVVDMIEHLEFDTIYHEHLFYYSLHALDALFRRNGLEVVDVERIPIHGGTLRVFAGHGATARPSPAVADLRAREVDLGVPRAAYYEDFAARIDQLCADLRALLGGLRAEGARIAAYGAAAKGATLLNVAGIGRETLEFVVDRSPHKQGRLMPGVHLEIRPPEALVEERPDYTLLLAWNFADEVVRQQQAYLDLGGRFVLPVPKPRVL